MPAGGADSSVPVCVGCPQNSTLEYDHCKQNPEYVDVDLLVDYAKEQSAIGTITGYRMVNGPWAEVEGVKATAEGWIAPLIFTLLYAFLLINMQDILYEIAPAAA